MLARVQRQRENANPKERAYTAVPEAAFCPACHRRVNLPVFLRTANIQGSVRVNCACKGGVIVIAKPAKAEA